jgi:capsular polysaccharide export protein
MVKSKSIITLLGSVSNRDFFLRLSKPFSILGYRMDFITYNYYVYAQRRYLKDKHQVELIRKSNKTFNIDVHDSLEVLAGKLSVDQAVAAANGVCAAAEKFTQQQLPSFIFMFNGLHIAEVALAQWAKERNIPIRFFELANLPGKIQIDPEGANARISLFQDESLVCNLPPATSNYTTWRNRYFRYCAERPFLKRSKSITSFRLEGFYNQILGPRMGAIAMDNLSLFSRLRNKVNNRFFDRHNDAFDCGNVDYVLFPMQVGCDTQLWNNSSIQNGAGILKAVDFATKKGLGLVIKAHPKETEFKELVDAYSLAHQNGAYFVNQDIYPLIENAKWVFTINSSVGLESRLRGIPTRVISPCIYKGLSDDQLARFIEHYLVDIDYTNSKMISVTQAESIL